MIAAASVTTPALVYVRTNGHLAPQVWREPVTDLTGYWQGRIVAAETIDADTAELTPLRTLAKIFPPPPAATEE